jgi:hypothetical protein
VSGAAQPDGTPSAPRARRERKPVRSFLLRRVLPPLLLFAYRRLAGSWRYSTENGERFETLLASGRPIVAAFLHARSLALLHYFSLPGRGRWLIMSSQSRDGEAMSQVSEGLGHVVARGSSGHGGMRALLEMIRVQRENPGLHTCVAVDGSRGPRGVVQAGVITLAQQTRAVILPIAASTGRAWIWKKSFDRAVIPKWRAPVTIAFGEAVTPPARLDAQSLESTRQDLEEALLALHEELDARTGLPEPEPLRVMPASVPP